MMTAHWRLALLIITLAVSGCMTPGPGTAITYSGDLHTNDTQLRMTGTIHDTTGSGPFDNVTVYFYTDSRDLITATDVGTLTGQQDITASVSPVPEYIVIDSPDFWEQDRIDVVYFERESGENYTEHTATARQDLPVQPSRS